MKKVIETRMSQRGVLTLPKRLRDRYGLHPGDSISIVDLEGVLVLCPGRLRIDSAAERLARKLAQQGESLDSMLAVLHKERNEYGGKS